MSVWSGIAAAGVAIVLAFVAVGQPLWEWRLENPQQSDVWEYGPFSAHHYAQNQTSKQRAPDRLYGYPELATLTSGAQRNMSRVFEDFGQFFIIGLIGALAGQVLAVLTFWKKLRGIFAGMACIGGCAPFLCAAFAIVFAIPDAANSGDLPNAGFGRVGFFSAGPNGAGTLALSTTPGLGWVLVLGAGLALAWASSDLWHLVPSKKLMPKQMQVTVKRVPSRVAPPAPPAAPAQTAPPEPIIEEVFVIGANGLLVKHMSRSLMRDKDRDVVGSMISAISSFVREAFTERDGEVHEVTLGDHRFVMGNESGLVLAVLVSSGDTEDIVHRLRHLLAILDDRYGDRLATWQGEPLEGIEDELQVLWQPYHLPPPPAT